MAQTFDPTTQAFLDSVGFKAPTALRVPFIPSRFPRTYAYDYVRSHVLELLSRGEVGHRMRLACPDNEQREDMLQELAYAYMNEHGISLPKEHI